MISRVVSSGKDGETRQVFKMEKMIFGQQLETATQWWKRVYTAPQWTLRNKKYCRGLGLRRSERRPSSLRRSQKMKNWSVDSGCAAVKVYQGHCAAVIKRRIQAVDLVCAAVRIAHPTAPQSAKSQTIPGQKVLTAPQ